MEILTRGLNLEQLAWANPRQLWVEANRPFRFSNGQKAYLLSLVEEIEIQKIEWQLWPKNMANLDEYRRISQKGRDIDQMLKFSNLAVALEPGTTSDSRELLSTAGEVLQNLGWHNGSHLGQVVELAGKLMNEKYTLEIRHHAADAIKNAAYYKGTHIPGVIGIAKTDWPKDSIRMRSGCIRAIQLASRHSRDMVTTEEVKRYLTERCGDENPVIAEIAVRLLSEIFE